MEQRSPEWFAARKGRVTGSNVGAILGCDPHRSSNDVMRSMVREWHVAERELKGNVATEYGQHNESNAVQDLLWVHDIEVTPCGFFEFYDWLGASPDGLIISDDGITDAIVEIKCPYGLRDKKGDELVFKTIEQQPHYYAQMQIEMLCADVLECYFYQWTPNGDDLQIIPFNEKWIGENLPKLGDFYTRYLKERESPEKHLAPKKTVIHDEQSESLVKRYFELKEQAALIESEMKEIISDLSDMTNGTSARIGDHTLSLVEKKGSVSYATAIKELLPNANLEPYRGKPSSYWVLK